MQAAATFAIIPVKALSAAKQRLAPVLPPQARRDLVLGMLQTVLGVVTEAIAARFILVVTPDPSVAHLAESKGARVLRERRMRGLNAAVRAGLAQACAEGASRALVLPADVPLITPGELASLLACARARSRCAGQAGAGCRWRRHQRHAADAARCNGPELRSRQLSAPPRAGACATPQC